MRASCLLRTGASAVVPGSRPAARGAARRVHLSGARQDRPAREPQEQAVPGSCTLLGFLQTGARLTSAAHTVWDQLVEEGDTVVDATCGNGHDTAFLAGRVGPTGQVYGFDIQEAAIASTTRRLGSDIPADQRPRLHLVCGCHSNILDHVPKDSAKLVCFNLGYLPSADKSVITKCGTTLEAIKGALQVVQPGGMVSVMCYTGHDGGMEEYAGVTSLLQGLPPQSWTSMEHRLLNRPTAPLLQLVWRRPDAPPES